MIEQNLKFPCLCYHEKSKRLYFIPEREFAKVSKGGSNFYRNLFIIDSYGKKFKVINYREKGVASVKDCLFSLQILKKLEIELKFIEMVSFTQIKNMIEEYLKFDKSFSSSKYSGIPLINKLNELKTINDLILFIK
jgi:hypothetical protein